MLPNGCGSFIQQWFSYGFAMRFSLWVALPLIGFRVAILVNFCDPQLLGYHLFRLLGRVEV